MQQLPSYLQQYTAPDIGAALSASLGSAMPPHVSIGGGRFTLIDAGNNEIPVPTFDPAIGVYLDACIVDVNEKMSRIYFAGSYDPNQEGTRPDCFSDNGVAPSISASAPQGPSCSPDPTAQNLMPDPTGAKGAKGCFWATWGSKINNNGKGVPACSSKQKIALLIPGFQTLFLLAVPPNSHGPLREYTEKCKGNGINMANLITRISFVPNVQGTLQFAPVTYIDEPTAVLRQAAYAEKKTDALVGRNDVPRPVGAIAAPAQAQQPTIATMTMLPANSTSQQVAEAFVGIQQPSQQVQQPAQQTTQWPVHVQQPMQQPVQQVQQPSDPAPAQRRRRRTAAEMAEANGAPANGQAPQQPAVAPQAPFPHPGQQTMPGGTAPQQPPIQSAGQTVQGSFGIAQPAAANPELAGMLDDFFKS